MTKPTYEAMQDKKTKYWHVMRTDVQPPYLIRAGTGEPYRFANKTRARQYAEYLQRPLSKQDIATDQRLTSDA
jgi:hypothetical protein